MKLPSILGSCLAVCLFPAVSQAALTSVYTFDESSGTTAADSIRGASGTGTLIGGPMFIAGKIGNAVDLDGNNDYISAMTTVPTGTTAFSMAAWVWADSAPQWATIVKNWGDNTPGAFHLGFHNSTGQISNFVSGGSSVIQSTTLSLGAWHHVALTYGSSLQTLYINGSSVGSAAASSSLTSIGTLMGIGAKFNDAQNATTQHWHGIIDDLAFWDNTLSAADVLLIKNNGDIGIGVIPEPTSAVLLTAGSLALLRCRRR